MKHGKDPNARSTERYQKDRKPTILDTDVSQLTRRRLHTLTAEELYAAHLHPYLSKATNELDIRVQKSQQENAVLLARIKDQRLEMERLLSGLEHAVADVEGSVNVMHTNQQPRLDELRGEVWQMDQEVAASRLVSGS